MLRISVLCLLLAGCGGLTIPKEVLLPTPVSCIKEMPLKPLFITDVELQKLPDSDFILSLGEDRLRRKGYEKELEAVLVACK